MKNITPTSETKGFVEFIDKYFGGKLRAFSTKFKFPHTNIYNNLKNGRLALTETMIEQIGQQYPEVDLNFLQKGSGTLVKYKDNKNLSTTNDSGDDELLSLKTISQMFAKAMESKDEVITVHKILIKRTEDLANSKDEIIKRDAEIKKVLYEFNSYLRNPQKSAS